MKHFFCSAIVLFSLVSCNLGKCRDSTFEQDCYGIFSLSTGTLSSDQKAIVKKYGWDTVRLVSTKEKKYYFITEDLFLKQFEGSWKLSGKETDIGCSILLMQNNFKAPVDRQPFEITIVSNDFTGFTLPFTKKIE